MKSTGFPTASVQSGFTILEVLVASIILMVSLLGMGALQATVMKKNISAMNKTHALEASAYLGDSLRSQFSSAEGSSGVNTVDFDNFFADFNGSNNYQSHYIDDCGSGCSRTDMTRHMLAEWEKMIGDHLPQGKGLITEQQQVKEVDGVQMNTTYYEVTIMWDDRQVAQTSSGSMKELGTNCGGNPTVDLACLTTIVIP